MSHLDNGFAFTDTKTFFPETDDVNPLAGVGSSG